MSIVIKFGSSNCLLLNWLFPSEQDTDSSSEEEDDPSDLTSEADRKLRKEHAEEIELYIASERNNLTKLLTEFPEDTKLTRKKAR